jgi:hypothetical protein
MTAPGDIPVMLKHVTMAIMKKGHQFPIAFEIARGSLTNQGYLERGSEKGPTIRLTLKGRKRNQEHMRKPARAVLAFDRLLRKEGDKLGLSLAPEVDREDTL